MEQLLMWLGAGAALLALLALSLALAARAPRPAALALLLVTGLAEAAALAAAALLSLAAYGSGGRALAAALPPLAVGLLGAALVAFSRQRPGAGLAPRARSWQPLRLAGLLAAIAVVTATSAHNAVLSAERALDGRRAELTALEQLLRPGVPLALNAAPLYEDAARRAAPLDHIPGGRAALEAVAQAPAAPALLEWTRLNASALALATEGAQRPGYLPLTAALDTRGRSHRRARIFELDRRRDGRDPTDVEGQHALRTLADLLRTRALQHAAAGRGSEAMADASTLLALADQTDSPWLQPEVLVESLLSTPGLDAAALAALHFPRREGLLPALQRTLVRDERWSLDVLGLLTDGTPESGTVGAEALVLLGALRGEAWQQEIEQRFDGLWEAVYAPPVARLAAWRAAEDADLDTRSWLPQVRWVTTALQARLAQEARRGCAEAGAAAARHRLLHGQWPASLDALVPDLLPSVPLDPFDGAPLRYQAQDGEARVSSIGTSTNAKEIAFTVRAR